MSLINDALKRARQEAPPVIPPPAAPPPRPPTRNSATVAGWLIPTVVIFLVMAAAFFIGWGMAHHTLATFEPETRTAEPTPANVPAASVSGPVIETPASASPNASIPQQTKPEPEPVSVNPLFAPKLQGIFYSPSGSTAILDGKSVRVGATFKQYKVTEITKTSVTLMSADRKSIKLVMDN